MCPRTAAAALAPCPQATKLSLNEIDAEEPEVSDLKLLPDTASLADKLKGCLQVRAPARRVAQGRGSTWDSTARGISGTNAVDGDGGRYEWLPGKTARGCLIAPGPKRAVGV